MLKLSVVHRVLPHLGRMIVAGSTSAPESGVVLENAKVQTSCIPPCATVFSSA